MSFEGREYRICMNGHLEGPWYTCGFPTNAGDSCSICQEKWQFLYIVDDTNFEGEEPDTVVVEDERRETCYCCGHSRVIRYARFRPSDSQMDSWTKIR